MKNFVIGFDGLSGTGKTSTAVALCENNNYLYLELGDLCRKIVPIYVKLKEQYDLEYIINYISNLNIGYKICNNKICFEIINEQNTFNENINIRSEIYNMVQIEKIKNTIYGFLANIIDKIKKKYTIILVGREVELIYSKLDYHFLFKTNDEELIKRIMTRDKINEEQALNRKNKEQSMHSFSKNVIICNTSRLKIEDVVNLVQNVLNYNNQIKKHKIKVQFLGTQSTGKTTTSKYCSKIFNDLYVSEKLREHMEENQLGYFDILAWNSNNWYDIISSQIKYEKERLKKAKKFIFVDSAAILYAIDFDLLKVKKIRKLVNKQIYNSTVIFVCDNDIPYIEDGLRPSKSKVIKTQQTIINYLNDIKIPYIILSGDINQRIKSIEHILK